VRRLKAVEGFLPFGVRVVLVDYQMLVYDPQV